MRTEPRFAHLFVVDLNDSSYPANRITVGFYNHRQPAFMPAAGHLERHPVDLPPAETAHALAQFQLWVDAAEAGKIGWVYYAARAGGG